MPSIKITLPRNRANPGTLSVLDAAGREQLTVPCLGKAAGEIATKAGNPSRNPLKRRGDTPLGTYLAHVGAAAFGRYMKSYGLGWIPIDPIGGDAQKAEDAGRTGLAIHGGRGNGPKLIPTAGCVRVGDADFAKISAALRGAKGFQVEIVEGA
ncbi:hypothetical protein sos41_31490 [Alphaproteobacteria bacterium SO-S41]|nr:hypothetical protein sos41_31490 [Alphaproteobacteria bacterium SO-S41]